MKELLTGLLLGFCVGVSCYYLVDGQLNKGARAQQAQRQQEAQAQLNMLQQLCPEVLQRAQAQAVKK